MKALAAVTIAAITMCAANAALADEALAKSSGCMTCHAMDTKKMGPSFKDIAAKYKGKADAAATVAANISAAKGHPAVKTSPEDVKKLTAWILAM
jgi:cytochrome c